MNSVLAPRLRPETMGGLSARQHQGRDLHASYARLCEWLPYARQVSVPGSGGNSRAIGLGPGGP